MSEQMNKTTELNGKNIFSFLYRTRIKAQKGDVPVANMSLLFSGVALLTAPWIVVGGAVTGAVLGYRYSVEKNAPGFASTVGDVVHEAKDNVKEAVQSFTKETVQEPVQAPENHEDGAAQE